MKISSDTIKVLQNFASINQNIRFREGNVISTIGPQKNIFAKATVTESFPKDFCIYDLNSLLSLVTLMDDQDIDFGDASLKISKDNGEFEFFYADESVIIAPEAGKSIPVDDYFSFKMSSNDVQMLNKAAAIVGAKFISVVAKKGKVTLSVGDPKTASSNSYKRVIGDFDGEFNCRLAVENFKVVQDAYTVTVSKKKFFHFKHDTKALEYWLAMEPDSVV
jgi:hypothetical protein